ncbi:unnamed protein product, partial [Nesidiocoris tenuis]
MTMKQWQPGGYIRGRHCSLRTAPPIVPERILVVKSTGRDSNVNLAAIADESGDISAVRRHRSRRWNSLLPKRHGICHLTQHLANFPSCKRFRYIHVKVKAPPAVRLWRAVADLVRAASSHRHTVEGILYHEKLSYTTTNMSLTRLLQVLQSVAVAPMVNQARNREKYSKNSKPRRHLVHRQLRESGSSSCRAFFEIKGLFVEAGVPQYHRVQVWIKKTERQQSRPVRENQQSNLPLPAVCACLAAVADVSDCRTFRADGTAEAAVRRANRRAGRRRVDCRIAYREDRSFCGHSNEWKTIFVALVVFELLRISSDRPTGLSRLK